MNNRIRKHVSIRGDLRDQFRVICESRGIPMSVVLARLINATLDKTEVTVEIGEEPCE